MFLARMRSSDGDGGTARIIASGDPSAGWVDVRRAEALQLARGGATAAAALRVAMAVVPSSMSEALAAGEVFLDAARRAIADASGDASVAGTPDFLHALDPSAYRDFMAFERHFSFGYKRLNLPVPDVLYELPVSYFGNALAFYGPGDEIPWPSYTEHMDYELELGIVIGRAGSNLTPAEASDHVVGLTILNDFSARDIQAKEMPGSLGPSKSKHFGYSAGPWIATLDEIPEGGLRMEARVNGERWSSGTSAEMIWSIGEIVAWASQGEQVSPGMLLGSGTCNGGSTIELDGRRLQPGDVVELEIDKLGVLQNRLGQPQTAGWTPEPKPRSQT